MQADALRARLMRTVSWLMLSWRKLFVYEEIISFEGKITDPLLPPSAWIIPSNELEQFIRKYKTRTVVSRADVKAKGEKFLHSWSLICGQNQLTSASRSKRYSHGADCRRYSLSEH